jgi:hypothetical protein
MSTEARELILFIENDADLYRQRHQPMILNLAKKFAKGKYDHALAPKLWYYLADAGAKKYVHDFVGRSAPVGSTFSVAVRKEVAAQLANDNLEEVMETAKKFVKPVKVPRAKK